MPGSQMTPEKIKALRSAYGEPWSSAEHHHMTYVLDAYQALQAERDRYKTALEAIVDLATIETEAVTDIAVRALAGGEGK